jgi:hypothetical protein
MIDSTIVRAHQHSAGARKKGGYDQAIGRSKGGLSIQDSHHGRCLGQPHRFSSHGGQACDLEGADVLPPLIESDLLLADKGFDADQRVLIPWKQARKTAVIPPKANRILKRHYDKELYKTRHLIEISLPNSNCFAPSLHVTRSAQCTSMGISRSISSSIVV